MRWQACAFGSAVSSTYRADGLRASKTTSSGTTYYLYDGSEPIVEMNSSGTVTALNIFAPDGLVARQSSSSTIQYVFDQQGNVADRLDSSGSMLSCTVYDPYGTEHVAYGSPSDPFGYNAQSGYYLDREDGLYLCQHRFYDPAQSRWLNRDPIGYDGGTNLYGYCAGGPVGWEDSSGHLAMALGLLYLVPGVGEALLTVTAVVAVAAVAAAATATVYNPYRREHPDKPKERFTPGGRYRVGPSYDPDPNHVHGPTPHIDIPAKTDGWPSDNFRDPTNPLPPERDPETGKLPGQGLFLPFGPDGDVGCDDGTSSDSFSGSPAEPDPEPLVGGGIYYPDPVNGGGRWS